MERGQRCEWEEANFPDEEDVDEEAEDEAADEDDENADEHDDEDDEDEKDEEDDEDDEDEDEERDEWPAWLFPRPMQPFQSSSHCAAGMPHHPAIGSTGGKIERGRTHRAGCDHTMHTSPH